MVEIQKEDYVNTAVVDSYDLLLTILIYYPLLTKQYKFTPDIYMPDAPILFFIPAA